MVTSVLRSVDPLLPVKAVRASHGKVTRAEPVAALYVQGRVSHVGCFPLLEDEMCGLMAGGGYAGPGRSPDRADALVWELKPLHDRARIKRGVVSRSEEHTSELQSLMRISYAGLSLKKKTTQ